MSIVTAEMKGEGTNRNKTCETEVHQA